MHDPTLDGTASVDVDVATELPPAAAIAEIALKLLEKWHFHVSALPHWELAPGLFLILLLLLLLLPPLP